MFSADNFSIDWVIETTAQEGTWVTSCFQRVCRNA